MTGSSVDAGKDAYLYAQGNVIGSNVHSGGDAAVITYGSFTGSVHAGRDVVAFGTGGNLSGTIVADRNIGQHSYYDDASDYDGSGTAFNVAGFGDTVMSYGAIDAHFAALNTTGSSIGGRIGSVRAVGSISDSLTAANEIGPIASGSTVTATLSAPIAPDPIEYDAGLGNRRGQTGCSVFGATG